MTTHGSIPRAWSNSVTVVVSGSSQRDLTTHLRGHGTSLRGVAVVASQVGLASLQSGWLGRVEELQVLNDDRGLPWSLAPTVKVPVDAVTASGSGLDPHISIANARLQAPRVAGQRGIPLAQVLGLVDRHTDHPALGEPGVNVVELNLALRDLGGGR
jgi:hypothetical protein